MKRIFKYPIPVNDKITLELPIGSDILTVGIQKGEPVIWALINTQAKINTIRHLELYGTGMEVPAERHYIGTFQMLNGGLVFHLFEVKISIYT
ncbi:MAG: hypothetical protein WD512_20655 [Candidatus Paceibacterota bacterium]